MSYYEAPDPIFCAEHGEDCPAEPMDTCEGFEPDYCDGCGAPAIFCHCDEDYERMREERWDD